MQKSQILNYFPFIKASKKYSTKKLRVDLIAGLTVAIVALPQTMAYAMIAGIPPQYGLYAAIIPVLISSLFGSSSFLISGPTNAISMLIASSFASVSIAGVVADTLPPEQKMALLFLLSVIVGTIQLAMGIGRLGNLISFISHSVVIGFTAGAGILIAFNQIKNFAGLSIPSSPHFIETLENTFTHLGEANLIALGVGIFTIVFILTTKKLFPKLPGALFSMVCAGLFIKFFGLENELKLIGEIPQNFPPISIPVFNLEYIRILFMPAFSIAILGLVEALSIAKSISNASNEKIDGSQEFIGQGLANIVAGFNSGMVGSGSFTRSAVNFRAGAQTRFAGVFSAVFVLIILISLAPLAKYIPIASLAGILMVTAYSMVDQKALKLAYKATLSDRTVMLITLFSTLFLELEIAVYIGVFLSIILFIRKVSQNAYFKKVCPRPLDNKLIDCDDNDTEQCCPQMSIFQIDGALFFGAMDGLEERFSMAKNKNDHVVIIRMKGVDVVDATGIHSLEKFLEECHKKNIRVIFTNVKSNAMRVFKNSGILEEIGKENIAQDTTEAIKFAFKKYIQKEICQKCARKPFRECHA